MKQEIVFTCPKCGSIMHKLGSSNTTGAIRYRCEKVACGWTKYIDTDHYKYVSINDYEKYKNEVEK